MYVWLWPTLLAQLGLFAVGRYDWAWKRRRILSEAIVGLLIAGFPFLFTTDYSVLMQVLLALLQLWAMLLALRLLFGRLSEKFLRGSTRQNSSVALVVLVLSFDIWLIARSAGVRGLPGDELVVVLLLFDVVIGLLFLYQVIWTLRHYRLRNLDQSLRLKDMPTVTLAIPARNEDRAMEACLRAAVASEYPKLEIIVLDDCSQDKTSEMVRSFAHEGVRFIQGEPPARGWIGRNQAMNSLADQASGEYVMYMDVDTHLSPQSINKLINFTLSNGLDMVSVLPYRRDGWGWATLLTQLRYYWQTCMPVTARRVPVATQGWMIRRVALAKLGGFDGVRQMVTPEMYFARVLFVHDRYRFIIANEEVGVTTAKKWSSQAENSIRYLYPTLKRQPLLTLLACMALVGLVLAPFIVLLMWPTELRQLVLAAVACGLFWLSYCMVAARTHPFTWPVTGLLLPFAIMQEVLLMLVSMILYEFGGVNWKSRDVSHATASISGRAR